jgi:hypothetical protein
MEPFPPNSRKAGQQTQQAKKEKVERVTSANAVRRRKPLGKKFSQVFIGGDAKTALEYMFLQVLIPAAKEAIVEAASSGFEKLVYGDSRPRRHRMGTPTSGPMGHVAYHRMSSASRHEDRPSTLPSMLPRRTRSRHDFDDIVINSRQEAEEVLGRLYDLISKYHSATVADLYELTGLQSSHTDHKWGWTALPGAAIGRVRGGGYLLDLPEPEYFE